MIMSEIRITQMDPCAVKVSHVSVAVCISCVAFCTVLVVKNVTAIALIAVKKVSVLAFFYLWVIVSRS